MLPNWTPSQATQLMEILIASLGNQSRYEFKTEVEPEPEPWPEDRVDFVAVWRNPDKTIVKIATNYIKDSAYGGTPRVYAYVEVRSTRSGWATKRLPGSDDSFNRLLAQRQLLPDSVEGYAAALLALVPIVREMYESKLGTTRSH